MKGLKKPTRYRISQYNKNAYSNNQQIKKRLKQTIISHRANLKSSKYTH